jgi:diguanylate cyclase (GGDEF)-like protein
MHRLYGIRAAVRLGAGTQYTLSHAALGLTAARFGFGRTKRRCLLLAELAAADLGDPQLVAQVAWYGGAADYLGRVDNGERWIQCLTDHGQWLDNEQYGDIVSAVCWDAAVQGRDDDVLRWAENGRVRKAFSGAAELTSLLTVPAIGLTAAGRPAAANAELRRVRTTLEQHGGRSLQVNLVLAELYALLEQDQLGDHFDAVAERFFAYRLSRTGMLRQHQSFFVLLAQGRLAQCRNAQYAQAQQPSAVLPVSVELRLAEARAAVRQLGTVAGTPLLKAAYQQSRAELLILEGNPKQALGLLSRLQPQREDAPLLSFEIARTTARALLGAGYPADARRQVLSAVNLAEDHGWIGRRSRLATEFGLRAVSPDQAPAPRSAIRNSTETTSAAKPVLEPAHEPALEPIDEPALEPAVEPAVEPGLEPGLEPIDEPVDEPVAALEAPINRELDLAATLRDTLVEMASSADPAEVLRQLVTAAGRVLPEGQAWLIRPAARGFGHGSGSLAEVLFSELPAPGTVRDLVFDPDLRAVAGAGLPVVGDPESIAPPQLRRLLADSASWMLFPLICDATGVGVLVLASGRPEAYADTQIAVAGALAAQGMAAYSKATLIARLQELTGTDELTGVRSLRQILELATRDLQGARHSSRPLVVMLVGIDRLGRINDLHGRATGDDVIRQVASRLGQAIRDTDLLGRYHEDEFIVVLSQGRDGETGIGDGGLEVAERLIQTVGQGPVPTRVGPLSVTVTIGLTLMTDDDADITALTARAETALHTAKQGGRNQVTGI